MSKTNTILTHLIIYAPYHVRLFLASPPTKISNRQALSHLHKPHPSRFPILMSNMEIIRPSHA